MESHAIYTNNNNDDLELTLSTCKVCQDVAERPRRPQPSPVAVTIFQANGKYWRRRRKGIRRLRDDGSTFARVASMSTGE